MTLRDEIARHLNYNTSIHQGHVLADQILALIQPRFDEIKQLAIEINSAENIGYIKNGNANKIINLCTLNEPEPTLSDKMQKAYDVLQEAIDGLNSIKEKLQ